MIEDVFGLDDRVALVTGGSRGIGRSIALGLGKAGARVVVSARHVQLLQEVVREIQENGGEAISVPCDLAKEKEILHLVDQTVQQWGTIDILVNNGGISPFLKRFEDMSLEDWETVIRINLTAPFLLSRESGKVMMQKGWGRIINIASVGGLVGFQRQGAYSVAKGGLIQMTKVLAVEWSGKYNITVNAIAPAYIATDLTAGVRSSQKISQNLLNRTPMGRFGEPKEIVTAVLYFCSPLSGYTTGSVLAVDGGWMAY